MLVIPAIDIRGGRCVRLQQGEFSRETVYAEDPAEVARRFESLGAQWLHIVDLDGARSGETKNRAVVENIITAISIPVQLGGGIRSLEQIKGWLDAGVTSVLVGTVAVRQPEVVVEALETFGGERLMLAIDARDGRVALEGWQKTEDVSAIMLAQPFISAGLQRVLYTDIARDGMLTGPNLEATKQLAVSTGLKVTASGGVSSKEDIEALAELEPFGVDSVVVGRALYEGRIKPEEVF